MCKEYKGGGGKEQVPDVELLADFIEFRTSGSVWQLTVLKAYFQTWHKRLVLRAFSCFQ